MESGRPTEAYRISLGHSRRQALLLLHEKQEENRSRWLSFDNTGLKELRSCIHKIFVRAEERLHLLLGKVAWTDVVVLDGFRDFQLAFLSEFVFLNKE